MKQIFLVEDDREIARNLMLLLQAEGYGVSHASSQKEAVSMLEKGQFDLALVDVALPDGNGFAVCTEIRQMQNIPVIFLTASGDEASVVTGLNIGSGLVRKYGKEICLSALEYRLLLIFAGNPGCVVTRERLLRELWDAAGEFVNDNTLTVYIRRLREKIEDNPASPKIILTVRGLGYRMGGRDVT